MKKENSTLLTKLKQYSALAAPLLAVAGMADAQVVYTNINPDAILDANTQTGEKKKIDLNNDGTFDFMLRHRFFSSIGGRFNEIVPYSTTSPTTNIGGVAGPLYSGTFNGTATSRGYPYLYPAGSQIDSNNQWFTLGDLLFPYATTGGSSFTAFFPPVMGLYTTQSGNYYGYWGVGATDGYVGVRLNSNGSTYYGWIRCDLASDGSVLTVKDYAYQSTAGVGIQTGAMGPVGVNTPDNSSDVSIFSFNRVLNVNFTAIQSEATIHVLNMMGQEMLNQKATTADNQINLGQIAAGNYVVQVNYEGKVISKKITVQ